MFTVITFTSLVIILILWSLRERVRNFTYGVGKGLDTDPRDSPFSKALTGLVGLAGGIYLSLVLFFTFVGVEVPPRMRIGDLELEPLATLAIGIAIFQPLFLKVFWTINHRK